MAGGPVRCADPRADRPRAAPAQLSRYRDALGTDIPVGAVLTFLRCWTVLYGAVAMEVFGHIRFALEDAAPMFEVASTWPRWSALTRYLRLGYLDRPAPRPSAVAAAAETAGAACAPGAAGGCRW